MTAVALSVDVNVDDIDDSVQRRSDDFWPQSRDLSPWRPLPSRLDYQYRNRWSWLFDEEAVMTAGAVVSVITAAVVVAALLLGSAVRVIKQYERGVHFR